MRSAMFPVSTGSVRSAAGTEPLSLHAIAPVFALRCLCLCSPQVQKEAVSVQAGPVIWKILDDLSDHQGKRNKKQCRPS